MAGTTGFEMKKALIREAKEMTELTELVTNDWIWDSAYSGIARPRKLLWFGEILWTTDRPVAYGKTLHQREEEYNIRFGIEINDYDQTQTEANDKAEDILMVIEDLARDKGRFQLNGLVSTGVVLVGLGEGPGGAEGGRAAIIAAQVNVKARK